MSFSFNLKAKKTPFQKQKELEEKKKKRDEEEAAKVYEEFVKDFGGADNDDPGKKAFVRGGVIQPGQPTTKDDNAGGGSGGGGDATLEKQHVYVPPLAPPPRATKKIAAAFAEDDDDEDDKEELAMKQLPLGRGNNKLRRMDILLENMKKEQAEREQRKEQGLDPLPSTLLPSTGDPALDILDQASTNIFVNNLAPDVDETTLLREFGRFGPIGSVKVMWPRDDEQRRRGKNTGFVAFMRREDAEKARDALDGVMLRDLQLSLGWGKSVPLPAVPVWPPPGSNTAIEDGGINNTLPGINCTGTVSAMPAAPESTRQRMHDGPPPKATVIGRGTDIEVTIPEDHRQRFIIDATAYYVLRDGCEFEQVVMEKEANNPEYEFLYDVRCPEHVYYRWRLFSLANGDSLRSWKVDPFLMVEKSNRWIPPPMTLVSAARKSATQRTEKREDAQLSEIARQKLRSTLQALTVDRQSICDAMVWILDHADHATEVSEILITALSASETPIILKIAHLFLLSDVLHNTSAAVRNVSRYRNRLQDALPDIFESLQGVYLSEESRMAQELLRKHVLKVLRVWRGWYIFSDDFLNGLQATFLRSGTGLPGLNKPITSDNHNSSETKEGNNAFVGVDPVLTATLEKLTDDEIELRCKHSGLSRKGGREAQVARIVALDGYLHGGDRQGKVGVGAVGGGNGGEIEKRGGAEIRASGDSPTRKKAKK